MAARGIEAGAVRIRLIDEVWFLVAGSDLDQLHRLYQGHGHDRIWRRAAGPHQNVERSVVAEHTRYIDAETAAVAATQCSQDQHVALEVDNRQRRQGLATSMDSLPDRLELVLTANEAAGGPIKP